MAYIIILYLLLSQHIGETTQQQAGYAASYTQNSTISDAHLVKDDPRFPKDYKEPKLSRAQGNATRKSQCGF